MTELLNEFRGFYPGSKVPLPVGPVETKEREKQPVAWDARPFRKKVSGKEVEFFTIGALSIALQRSVVTLRHWIREGHLPQATYRLPDRMRNGRTIKGRRLYTREQIEAIVLVAHRHNILDPVRVDWAKHDTFAEEIREAWTALPSL